MPDLNPDHLQPHTQPAPSGKGLPPMNTITLKDTNGNPIAQYPLNDAVEQHIEAINGAYY